MITSSSSQGSRAMAHNLDDLRERWLSRKRSESPAELAKEIIHLPDDKLAMFVERLEPSECHQIIMAVKSIQKDIKRQLHKRSRRLKSQWGIAAIHMRDRCDIAIKCIIQNQPKKKYGPLYYFNKLVKKHISSDLYEALWDEARKLSDNNTEYERKKEDK